MKSCSDWPASFTIRVMRYCGIKLSTPLGLTCRTNRGCIISAYIEKKLDEITESIYTCELLNAAESAIPVRSLRFHDLVMALEFYEQLNGLSDEGVKQPLDIYTKVHLPTDLNKMLSVSQTNKKFECCGEITGPLSHYCFQTVSNTKRYLEAILVGSLRWCVKYVQPCGKRWSMFYKSIPPSFLPTLDQDSNSPNFLITTLPVCKGEKFMLSDCSLFKQYDLFGFCIFLHPAQKHSVLLYISYNLLQSLVMVNIADPATNISLIVVFPPACYPKLEYLSCGALGFGRWNNDQSMKTSLFIELNSSDSSDHETDAFEGDGIVSRSDSVFASKFFINQVDEDIIGITRISGKNFPSLSHLTVIGNPVVEVIKRLPRLNSLYVENCHRLERIGQPKSACASLTNLTIISCHKLNHNLEPNGRHLKLEKLRLQEVMSVSITYIGSFLFLQHLILADCPNIEYIMSLPELLTMNIENCDALVLPNIDECMFPKLETLILRNISSLQTISSIPYLTSVRLIESSRNLRVIDSCPSLMNVMITPRKASVVLKSCPKLMENYQRRQNSDV